LSYLGEWTSISNNTEVYIIIADKIISLVNIQGFINKNTSYIYTLAHSNYLY